MCYSVCKLRNTTLPISDPPSPLQIQHLCPVIEYLNKIKRNYNVLNSFIAVGGGQLYVTPNILHTEVYRQETRQKLAEVQYTHLGDSMLKNKKKNRKEEES